MKNPIASFLKDLQKVGNPKMGWKAAVVVYVSPEGNFMTLSSKDEDGDLDFIREAVEKHCDVD